MPKQTQRDSLWRVILFAQLASWIKNKKKLKAYELSPVEKSKHIWTRQTNREFRVQHIWIFFNSLNASRCKWLLKPRWSRTCTVYRHQLVTLANIQLNYAAKHELSQHYFLKQYYKNPNYFIPTHLTDMTPQNYRITINIEIIRFDIHWQTHGAQMEKNYHFPLFISIFKQLLTKFCKKIMYM